MWTKIKKYTSQYRMIQEGEHILAGVSGGADSICLLRFLQDLSKEQNLKIYAVHINHMIRAEGAVRDESFVREYCEKWQIPLKVYRIDVPSYAKKHHMTEEEAGRAVRYQCFEEMSGIWNCQKIALAHHEDDLAETVLFRMARGTGVTGLGAIEPIAGNKIRPMLCVTKKEILQLLEQLNQEFMEDETNDETEYSRNYIRHEIMPKLSVVNAKASEHFAQLALQAQELKEVLEPIIESSYERCVKQDDNSMILLLKLFAEEKSFIQSEILRRILFSIAGKRKDISQIHIEQIQKLIYHPVGKRWNLPYQIEAVKEKNQLRFYKSGQWTAQKKENVIISAAIPQLANGETFVLKLGDSSELKFAVLEAGKVTDYTKGDCVKYFDYDKINRNVCIRNKRDGDYLIVDRQNHKKMLRRYFIDAKIPREERENQLLLAEGSHVLWILGRRISESYKVTESTKYILKVSWQNNNREE